jgi:hypothetical protein
MTVAELVSRFRKLDPPGYKIMEYRRTVRQLTPENRAAHASKTSDLDEWQEVVWDAGERLHTEQHAGDTKPEEVGGEEEEDDEEQPVNQGPVGKLTSGIWYKRKYMRVFDDVRALVRATVKPKDVLVFTELLSYDLQWITSTNRRSRGRFTTDKELMKDTGATRQQVENYKRWRKVQPWAKVWIHGQATWFRPIELFRQALNAAAKGQADYTASQEKPQRRKRVTAA